jgi:hypothetical protein
MLLGFLCAVTAQGGSLQIQMPGADRAVAGEVLSPVSISAGADNQAVFQVDGAQWIGTAGEPRAPWQVLTLLLPPDADTSSLVCRLEGAEYEELDGIWRIDPIPPPATRGPAGETILAWPAGKQIVEGRDRAAYGMSGFWPEKGARVLGCGRLHGWLLCQTAVPLVRWNPATGRMIRLVSASLHLEYERTPAEGSPAAQVTGRGLRGADRAARLAVNFESACAAYGGGRSGARAAGYTIITTSEIVSSSTALSAFIAHKTALGFTVRLVTEDDFGGGTGDAAAENIRAWLQANYLTDETLYVLLIGNPHPAEGDLPMKRCYDSVGGMYETPSDFFYSDLTGDWDLNQDGYAGQWEDMGDGGIDRFWEVLVGRIPYYGQIADTDHILQKIIDYELEADSGWRRRALLPMVPLDDATQSYELGEQMKAGYLEGEAIPSHRLYVDDYGLVPGPETIPCNYDNVTAAWSAAPYGIVVWSTHGWNEGAVEVATSDTILALDDDHPSATWHGSCSNAEPEHPRNIAYALLRHGGIATNGATRSSWYYVGETSYSSSTSVGGLGYQYAARLVAGQTCGRAWADVRQEMVPGIWSNFSMYNIYGDPSVVVVPPPPAFTVSPTDLFVVSGVRHEAWHGGQRTFTLTNNGATPFNWSATASVPWLELVPTSGTLAGGEEAQVLAQLSATSGELPVGQHQAGIAFSPSTGSLTTLREVEVSVIPRVMTVHWKLDEQNGFIAYDASGFNNRGFLEGGVRFQNDAVPGRFGGALRFHESGYKINMEHLGLDDIPPPWTMAMWVRKTENITGASCLFSSTTAALRLEQWNNDDVGLTIFGGGGDHSFGYSAPLGQWVHLTFVGSGSGTTLWVNGLPWATVDRIIAAPMTSLNTSLLRLAAEVDDVRIYNHTLSTAGIKALERGGQAMNPTPPDGAAGVTTGTDLGWLPGIGALAHDVYLGSDADAVALATTGSPEYMGRFSGTTYLPALLPGQDYYWRVDEVTFGGSSLEPIQGEVWTFSTMALETETVSAQLTCVPSSGTLPFSSVFTATLTNLATGESRRAAARLDVFTASGQSFPGWRAGWSNLDDGESFAAAWTQQFPALGSLAGDNAFTLRVEDVTPPPYNQPPYSPAGHSDSDHCTVAGAAP